MCVGHQLMAERVVDDCHLLAHGVAEILWDREMKRLKERGNETFSEVLDSTVKIVSEQCDAVCSHGCAHATMEHFMATVSCADCPDPTARLLAAFSTASGLLEAGLLKEVQHGLGHGLLRVRHLAPAMQFCADSDFEERCLDGVFMQYFYDKSLAEPNGTLWTPRACDSFPEAHRAQCAGSVGEALMFAMWHDAARAQAVCQTISDDASLVDACTKGVSDEKIVHDAELVADESVCQTIANEKTVCFVEDLTCGLCRSVNPDGGCTNDYMASCVKEYDSQCAADMWDTGCAYVVQHAACACMPNALSENSPFVVPNHPDDTDPIPAHPDPIPSALMSVTQLIVAVSVVLLVAILIAVGWRCWRRRLSKSKESGPVDLNTTESRLSLRKRGFEVLRETYDDEFVPENVELGKVNSKGLDQHENTLLLRSDSDLEAFQQRNLMARSQDVRIDVLDAPRTVFAVHGPDSDTSGSDMDLPDTLDDDDDTDLEGGAHEI